MFIKGLAPHASHSLISMEKYGGSFEGCEHCGLQDGTLAIVEACPISYEEQRARAVAAKASTDAWWAAQRWWEKTLTMTMTIGLIFGLPVLGIFGAPLWSFANGLMPLPGR